MKQTRDPLTGETFIKRRSNQVFANRKNQIRFNNLRAHKKRRAMGQINRLMENNRKFLKSILNGKQEVTKSIDFLYGSGFYFGVFTHSVKKNTVRWTCIYNYAYQVLDNAQVRIINI